MKSSFDLVKMVAPSELSDFSETMKILIMNGKRELLGEFSRACQFPIFDTEFSKFRSKFFSLLRKVESESQIKIKMFASLCQILQSFLSLLEQPNDCIKSMSKRLFYDLSQQDEFVLENLNILNQRFRKLSFCLLVNPERSASMSELSDVDALFPSIVVQDDWIMNSLKVVGVRLDKMLVPKYLSVKKLSIDILREFVAIANFENNIDSTMVKLHEHIMSFKFNQDEFSRLMSVGYSSALWSPVCGFPNNILIMKAHIPSRFSKEIVIKKALVSHFCSCFCDFMILRYLS